MPIKYQSIADDSLVLVSFELKFGTENRAARGKQGLFQVLRDRIKANYADGCYYDVKITDSQAVEAKVALDNALSEERDAMASRDRLDTLDLAENDPLFESWKRAAERSSRIRVDAEESLRKAEERAAMWNLIKAIKNGEVEHDTPVPEEAPKHLGLSYGIVAANFLHERRHHEYEGFDINPLEICEG